MATYPKPPYQDESPGNRQRRAREGVCQNNPSHGSVLICTYCFQIFDMGRNTWDAKKYRDTLCSGCGFNPQLNYRVHCDICWDPERRAENTEERTEKRNEERRNKKLSQRREARAELKKKNQCECRMDCPRKGKRCFFRVFNEASTLVDAVEAVTEDQWEWLRRHRNTDKCLRLLAIRIAVNERTDDPEFRLWLKKRSASAKASGDPDYKRWLQITESVIAGHMDSLRPKGFSLNGIGPIPVDYDDYDYPEF